MPSPFPALNRRRIAGMSLLLEVILGLGLFSTCLLLLFGIFPTSKRTLVMARDRGQAIQIAKEILELQRFKDYGDLVNVPTFLINENSTVNGVPTLTSFYCNVAIQDLVTASVKKGKDIMVTVSWYEGADQGNPSAPVQFTIKRSVQMEAYVAVH